MYKIRNRLFRYSNFFGYLGFSEFGFLWVFGFIVIRIY